MGKVCKTIGNILIFLVILACLPIVLPKLFGFQAYNVISGSMEPQIPVGSLVYVQPVDFESIEPGDVIAFESGASVVTHRVISIDEDNMLFTTKGDANADEDFIPVAYTNVIGEAHAHCPFFGNIAAWLFEPVGKMVAVIMLLVGAVLSGFGEKKEKKKDVEAAEAAEATTKKRNFNPKIILYTALILLIGSTGTFLYIYMGYQKSNSYYEDLNQQYAAKEEAPQEWYDMIDVDIPALQNINPDVIGWIYVEGTDISYPIMYSGDDEKYLRTTMGGEAATAGSIFLEGYNLPDFSDSHNVIYGHNMRNLSMFGSLKFYKSEDNYLQDHKYFQIITADCKYRYEIFSYFDTEAASWVYGVPYSANEDFGNYIAQLLSHSYEDILTEEGVSYTDKITTLSTCSTTGRRFTVHGYLCATH